MTPILRRERWQKTTRVLALTALAGCARPAPRTASTEPAAVPQQPAEARSLDTGAGDEPIPVTTIAPMDATPTPVDVEEALQALTRADPERARALRRYGGDDESSRLAAWRSGRFLVVEGTEIGNGVDGGWNQTTTVLDQVTGAHAVTVESGAIDGEYVSTTRIEPPDAEREAVLAALPGDHVVEVDGPIPAQARLFLGAVATPTRRARGGFTIVGPLYVTMPETPAPPSAATCEERGARTPFYVPVDVVRSEQLPATQARPDDDPRNEPEVPRDGFLRIAGIGPCPRTTVVGAIELREHALSGRNDGVAVMIVDGARGVGRWALETRIAVLGSSVRWLGERDGIVFGEYVSGHPGYVYAGHAGLVALRARDGAAFRIDVQGAFEHDSGVEHEMEEGGSDERERVCVERRMRAERLDPEVDEVPESIARACAPNVEHAVLGERSLRVERADGRWVALPIAELLRALR